MRRQKSVMKMMFGGSSRKRSSNRRSFRGNAKLSGQPVGKGFWRGAYDTFCFQPNRSGMMPVWRDLYKINREFKEMERNPYQPTSVDDT
jgi:hypothetical protein